jgi:PIN domain nuclease of toxin-antitoxin system
MKVVLDAYAVIAALLGERARAEVQPLIKKGVMCAPNVAEVLDGLDHAYAVETVDAFWSAPY